MGTRSRINQCVGIGAPYVNTFPIPIVADRAPASTDLAPPGQLWIHKSGSPPWDIYTNAGDGQWSLGGNDEATTSSFGIVELATLSELQNGNAPAGAYVPTANDVATVIAGVVVGAVPPATETQQGIAEIATQVETDAGVDDARIVTPLKLANFVASGGFPGVFTDLTATGAVSFTGATGGLTMTSATASSLGVTGAGIDLTLSSSAGQVIVNGEEAAANAVRVLSAAGGLDVDVALLLSLTSSRNNANAIELVASAGGIDISAVGTAGEDIDIVATGSSVNINSTEDVADSVVISSTNGGIDISALGASAGEDIDITATGSSINLVSTENAALAIFLHANGGTTETIQIRADQGTGAASVELLSDAGGVTVTAGAAAATAFTVTTTDAAGGATMTLGTGGLLPTTTGPITLVSTYNNAGNMYLHANGGTSEVIKIHADQGTAVTSLDLLSDVGGITLRAGLGNADAINITATAAGGGIDIDAGTAGVIVDTTGAISLDSAAASNFTVTGAFDLTLNSTAGSVVITGAEAAVDAVQINAVTALGGVDINAGTGGMTVDSGGLLSLDAAGVVNLTTTGAFDITINSTAGSVILTGAEAAVDAVQINATTAGGGIDMNAGSGGVTVDTTAAISLDSATASNFTVTGAADLTLASSAGAVNVTSGEANADSINVTSGGGMNIVATGAAAKDVIITCTSGSMTLSAGESVTDAMNFTAGGAASGINLTAGTNGILFSSGQKCKVTAYAATSGSPYTLLGTDYYMALDVTGGILTVTLPASPATGREVIISDAVGQSGANTITIDGNGKNISLAGTAAGTKTIATAYKAVGLVYNGTIWNGYALA